MKKTLIFLLLALIGSFYQVGIVFAQLTSTAKIERVSFGFGHQETEQIRNGSFENQLREWETRGEVVWFDQPDVEFSPRSRYFVRLGSREEGHSGITSLSQTFTTLPHPPFLHFWYQVVSYENLCGFDQPSLDVKVNGVSAFRINWENVFSDQKNQFFSSGWREVVIALPNQSLTSLSFEVNNTGDAQQPTWVYLSEVSSLWSKPGSTERELSELNVSLENNQDGTVTVLIKEARSELTTIYSSGYWFQTDDLNWFATSEFPILETVTWLESEIGEGQCQNTTQVTALTLDPSVKVSQHLKVKKVYAVGNQSAISSLSLSIFSED